MRMHELIKDAVDELREWAADNPGEEPDIASIVDGHAPVYDSDILDLARDVGLLHEPLGHDGRTVIQGLSWMICGKVEEALREDWERIEEEL